MTAKILIADDGRDPVEALTMRCKSQHFIVRTSQFSKGLDHEHTF